MEESGMGSRFSVPTALALEREVLFRSNTRKSLPVKMASFRTSKNGHKTAESSAGEVLFAAFCVVNPLQRT